MLSLLRRWILPSSSLSASTAASQGFFSPHYVPAISLSSQRVSNFSTYPPLYSDNKPSNPGTKPSNKHPPPATSPPTSSTASSQPVPSTPDDPSTYKPTVSPAWNELMSILTKHVYETSWPPEAQARYAHLLKHYPYISPETRYSTGLPTPGGMTSREACQSAAEEALFADYRPLRAGFAEDYIENVNDEGEGELALDFGHGVMHFSISRTQLFDLMRKVAGKEIDTLTEDIEPEGVPVMEMTSTRRKRKLKMKKHKRRKLRRRQRTEKKRMGKI